MDLGRQRSEARGYLHGRIKNLYSLLKVEENWKDRAGGVKGEKWIGGHSAMMERKLWVGWLHKKRRLGSRNESTSHIRSYSKAAREGATAQQLGAKLFGHRVTVPTSHERLSKMS